MALSGPVRIGWVTGVLFIMAVVCLSVCSVPDRKSRTVGVES